MKRLFLGAGITLLLFVFAGFVYLRMGFLNTCADLKPSSFESEWAMRFLDASVDRHAPPLRNPADASEANLIDAVRLYKANCAGCHGSPSEKDNAFGRSFYPPAPNFMEEAPDMPENQNLYIIKRGVRWTGMPAWGNRLNDQQIGRLTAFLSHMKKLPVNVQQEWEKPSAPASGAPGDGSAR